MRQQCVRDKNAFALLTYAALVKLFNLISTLSSRSKEEIIGAFAWADA